MSRTLSGLVTLALWIAAAPPLDAQRSGLAAARRSDFDIRGLAPATEAERSARRQSDELVARRRGGLESYARAAGGSIRLAPNRHGLPKTYSRDGRVLTAPANGEPEDIARAFLRANRTLIPFSAAEIDRLRLTGKDVSGRAVFLAFNQTLDGVDVYNGQIKVTMTAAGEVVHAGVDDIVPQLTLTNTRRITAEQAMGAAFETLGLARPPLARISGDGGKARFGNPRGERFSPIAAELTIFPLTAGTGRLAHRLSIEADAESWYEILIDAEDGRLLLRHNLYSYAAQARVWLESPMVSVRELVTFPEGWIPATGSATTGNNADAWLDANGDDRPDSNNSGGLSGGRASSADQMFDFPFGDGVGFANPRGFPAAAVTNAFYLVNKAHDYYYALGFTEAAGNFQFDNFGRGGSANDPVLAEVQHSSLTNNASFATPADGSSPRMRLGIFTRGTSSQNDDLDTAFDGGVVFHEYTHGVSNRLVGARTATTCLSGVQSRAMGEGWSDYFAASFYGNPVHGAYVTQNPAHGTRRFAYNNYPYTYEDLGIEGFEVHDDGEIWAAALWDLRSALGQEVADQLVLNGLKATPCRPSMIDARDAILAADTAANGGANRPRIWQVFARRGLGFSSAGLDGSLYPGIYFNAAFDQPPDLQPGGNPTIVGAPPSALPRAGDAYTYSISTTNPGGGALSYTLTQGPDGMTVDGNGVVRWTAGFTQQRVKVTVADIRGGKVVHGFVVTPETTLRPGESISIAGQRGSIGYANVTVPVDAPIFQVALRDGLGDADLDIFDPDGINYWSEREGNVETLSIATPKPGRWRISISAFRTYSSLSVTPSIVTPAPIAVNSPVSDLSGVTSSETFFRFTVPPGASALKVSTSGGTGDLDLYLRSGRPVACQVSSAVFEPCARDMLWSEEESTEESIQVMFPAEGDWYVSLSAFEEFRGVTLRVEVTLPGARPTISVAPASLVFIQPAGGSSPAPQSFTLAMAGGTASWTASASSAGNWLAVSPAAGTGAATIQVNVAGGALPTGVYSGTIAIAVADADGSPLTIVVALTVGAITPAISAGGIVGAAGTLPPVTTISPGGLASIFGSGFAPAGTAHAVQASDLAGGRLPTRLAGACVEVEGRRAFLTFVSPGQINFQVPAVSLNTQVEARVLVNCGGAEETRSAPASVRTAAAAPEFLYWTKNADGRNPVVAVNAATGAYAGRAGLIAGATFTPARPGDVLTVYGVSFGPTTPSFEPGEPPAGIGNTVSRPSVSLGGVALAPEDVLYAGVSPEIAGLYQLNIRVPAATADGDHALVLNLGSFRTPEAGILSVRAENFPASRPTQRRSGLQ
jgi:uncharacterized protein (TIGR03437 family)